VFRVLDAPDLPFHLMSSARLLLVLLLIGLGSSTAWGQERDEGTGVVPDTVVQRVSGAFQSGNAQLLLTPAADRVEVSLFGARTVYSSAQAFYVLREFFERHPPNAFVLADTTGTGASCFLRGVFNHGRGERPLQVYVRFVRHGAKTWQLHEVRIDTEAE
jgi:hypothetical protein